MAFLENTQVQEQFQVPTPQVDDPPKKKKLWDYMTKKRLYTKSYEDFDTQFSTPEKVSKLYNFLTEKKQYTKTEDDFVNQFFEDVKKKEPAQPIQQPKEAVTTPTIQPSKETAKTSTNGAATQEPTNIPSQLGVNDGKKRGEFVTGDILSDPTTNEPYQIQNGEKVYAKLGETKDSPIPLSKEKQIEQPKEDVITLAKQADDLGKKTIQLPTNGGMMGTAPTEMPDENAIAQSKELKAKIKQQGYDADELNEAFKDFPEDLFNRKEYSKEKLLVLNKTNKNDFYRTVASAKWQSILLNAIKSLPQDDRRTKTALADWNSFLKNQQLAKDYEGGRQHTRDIVNMVYKYVDNVDEQNKILGYLGKDLEISYDPRIKGVKEALSSDPRKKYLTDNELLGLQYYEDINPQLANTFDDVLVDGTKLDTNAWGDNVDKGEQLGLQQQKIKLATQGLSIKSNAINEEKARIAAKGVQVTPEEKEKYDKLNEQSKEVEAEIKELTNPKSKEYGKLAEYNLDGVAQELFGQRHGLAANQGLKFLSGVGGNVGSVINMVAKPFLSDEGSKVWNLGQIGQSIKSNKNTYTTQENSLMQHFAVEETPAFTQQKNAILNDPNLTDEQKIQKGVELLSNNDGWQLVAPSKELNAGIMPLIYGIADTANGLGQFILTSTLLKGVPALSGATKASNFANIFASTFLQSFQPKLTANLTNNEEYPTAKAFLSSSIDGILFGAADKAGVIKKMFSPKSSIGKVINELSDAELNNIIKISKSGNVFKDILNAALSSAKHATPMVAAGVGGSIANDYINNDLKKAEEYFKEGLMQQAMFTLLGVPMGAMGKRGERKDAAKIAQELIDKRKQVDPTFGVTVEMPSEVAKQREGEVITTQPKEYTPETKKSGVTVILPKQNEGEIITTKAVTEKPTESTQSQSTEKESGVVTEPIEVSENEKQGEVVGENTALKDVESTTKALIVDIVQKDDFDGSKNQEIFVKASNLVPKEIWKGSNLSPSDAIALAYHKAKKDNSNPKLIEAVETLLGKPKEEVVPTKESSQTEKERNREQKMKEEGLMIEVLPLSLEERVTPERKQREKEVEENNQKVKARIREIDAEFDAKNVAKEEVVPTKESNVVEGSGGVGENVITPNGFTNRVFESNIQLGEAPNDAHISEEGYNYRVLSQNEIDAISESGGVFAREGKQKGGNKNTKYWTKGNNKNWYGDKDGLETIRVKQDNFKENEVVRAENVEVYNRKTKQFEPLIKEQSLKETPKTETTKEDSVGVGDDVELTQEQKVNKTTKALDGIDKADLEFISRKENNRRKGSFYEKAKGILFKGFGGNASIISDKFGSKYKYFTDNPDYAKSFSLEKEYLTQKGKVEKYQTDYKREYNTNEKHYNEEVLNHSGKKSYIDLTSKDYDNFNDKLKDDGYDVVNIKRTEPLIPSESYRGHSADIRNVEVEEHLILNDKAIKKIADQPSLLENNAKSISEAYHKAKADGSNPELVKAVEQSIKETTKAETPKAEAPSIAKNPVLESVEATAKALEGVDIEDFINNKYPQGLTGTRFYRDAQEQFTALKGLTNEQLFNEEKRPDSLKTQEQRVKFNQEFQKWTQKNKTKIISEAYRKAKADGNNPELVKAVEQSIKETTKAETPTPTQESNVPVSETKIETIKEPTKVELGQLKNFNDKLDKDAKAAAEFEQFIEQEIPDAKVQSTTESNATKPNAEVSAKEKEAEGTRDGGSGTKTEESKATEANDKLNEKTDTKTSVEGGGKEPPKEKVAELVEEGGGEERTITHAAVNKLREKLGMPKYEGKETETHAQLLETAKELIKGGFDLKHIYDKIKNGDPTTNVENAIMAEYKAALDIELENNPSKETLAKATEFAEMSDVAGTLLGKGLESRKIVKSLAEANTLSNFLVGRERDKGHKLSDAQIKEETAKFKEVKAAEDAYEQALAKEKEADAKLIAEKGLQQAKKEKKAVVKKSHEEYVAERKSVVEKAKQALAELKKKKGGELTAVPLPFVKGIAERSTAIAPYVKDYVKSLLNEGIDKLDDIATMVHDEFKDVVDGLTKKDVLDIIGGVYDAKKETLNDKAAKLRLLKREAQLLNELAAARKGEEVATTETKKSQKTRRIEELENQIKEVRRLNKQRELNEEGVAESGDVSKISKDQATRKRLLKEIDKLQNDIKNKNYEKPEPPLKPLKLSRETQALQDKAIALRNKLAADKAADQREKMSGWEKAWDKFQNIAGVRRLVQTAFDASIWFRQLGSLALNPRKWDIAGKYIAAGSKSVFSEKNYSRIMDGIHKSPDFKETLEDGIRYNELDAVDPKFQNEMFQKSFIMKIPILKDGIRASQRIADASLNVARYELYQKYKNALLKNGITRESDPEMYKDMAKLVMNSTGSGNLLSALENHKAEKLLGATFYGARLMAANFNTLNPLYYAKMPKEVRMEAMKDLAAYTSTMMALGAGLAASGGKISLNPDDSDFLQVRFGEKVYDITSGKAAYIRTFLRNVEAVSARFTKTKYEANKAMEKALQSDVSFFRNKLSPNTGYAINALTGKSSIGKEFDPYEVAKIYPMYADDMYKAAKEDGFVSLLTVLLPNITGVGYGAYYSEPQKKSIDETIERNTNSDELNKETIKNHKEGGRIVTDKEFQQFADKRDELIKSKIKDLYHKGVLVTDEKTGEPVNKKYDQLTKEQIVKETSRIKSEATKKAKEELFGKEEKNMDKIIQERALKQARKEKDTENEY